MDTRRLEPGVGNRMSFETGPHGVPVATSIRRAGRPAFSGLSASPANLASSLAARSKNRSE